MANWVLTVTSLSKYDYDYGKFDSTSECALLINPLDCASDFAAGYVLLIE